MNSIYLKDDFVNVKMGEGFRLFPFGRVVKSGKARNITPEFAATIKLPHFKVPIKLGSHDDTTPAGGHIVALEVRADGLYAMPEWNDKGSQALLDGAFRYQSPEILWDGALEDPTNGTAINGPLILGTALLHTPHLGEAAAMYSIEEITNKEKDMNENMTIPTALWEKFIAPLFAKAEPEKVEVKVEVVPEDYEAAKQERDQYKALIETQKAEVAKAAVVLKFETELKATKADPTLAALLADVSPETADAIMKQFKALSEQINETVIAEEKGVEGGQVIDDPKAAFNAAVLAISAEKNISYNAAFEQVKGTHADLFKAAFAK